MLLTNHKQVCRYLIKERLGNTYFYRRVTITLKSRNRNNNILPYFVKSHNKYRYSTGSETRQHDEKREGYRRNVQACGLRP